MGDGAISIFVDTYWQQKRSLQPPTRTKMGNHAAPTLTKRTNISVLLNVRCSKLIPALFSPIVSLLNVLRIPATTVSDVQSYHCVALRRSGV